MKHDEFAFFNQQLAAMLREDIPLEGALRQLCAGMRKGPLRDELQRLEADLAGGTPLPDALSRRALPELYRRMVTIGVRGNDLPGVLLLLADHYHRHNTLWARLKGLLLYPLIVLVVALGLTLVLTLILKWFLAEVRGAPELLEWGGRWRLFGQWPVEIMIWFPPIALALGVLAGVVAATLPACRARLRWRLPAFREASLAQLASAIALMLKNGATLPEALALAEALESHTPAAAPLARWRRRLEAGQGKPADWDADNRPFPPLFLWLVQRSGEDVAAGFQQAADLYRARASYRIEMMLYGALPVAILLLGLMVLWQAAPGVIWLTRLGDFLYLVDSF